MTDHDDPSIHRNDPSIQVYFGNEFASDSQMPLEPGQDAVAWIEGGAVLICPLERLDDLPHRLDGPPSEAVPASHCDRGADGLDFDPDLLPDGHDDQPADQDRTRGRTADGTHDTDTDTDSDMERFDR